MSSRRLELDRFLRDEQGRALRIAQLAVGDDALDAVQDAMIALAKHYADKPRVECPALFYRVRENRLRRWSWRAVLTRRWFGTQVQPSVREDGAEAEIDPLADLPAPAQQQPDAVVLGQQQLSAIRAALEALPHRQRQAFLLRHWRGLSTEETAAAMECSTGSVKTHLSRAIARLQQDLA